jgi:hypothetical protein
MEEANCFSNLGMDIDRDGGMRSVMKHRVSEERKLVVS